VYDPIQGTVTEKLPARAVLSANGVGYEVKVSMTTSHALRQGEPATLYTILHVVDGTPTLLGFATRTERELARRILNVTGVGPTIALSVLSVYTPEEFAAVIAANDAALLRKVKGIGQKTAERLCLELRDVMAKMDFGPPTLGQPAVLQPASSSDAIAALITLGYSDKEARDKVDKARTRVATATTEELVRAVLQM
jgi:Holliday junction DNA helicase RuvA